MGGVLFALTQEIAPIWPTAVWFIMRIPNCYKSIMYDRQTTELRGSLVLIMIDYASNAEDLGRWRRILVGRNADAPVSVVSTALFEKTYNHDLGLTIITVP